MILQYLNKGTAVKAFSNLAWKSISLESELIPAMIEGRLYQLVSRASQPLIRPR